LGHFNARENSAQLETHTDWDLFRSLTSNLFKSRLQVDNVEEVKRAACAFTASVASGYAINKQTNKQTLSDLNTAPLDLDCFLIVKRRLRKLWHETRDPTYKTPLNWVTKTNRKMVGRKVIEWWESKLNKSEINLHAI
jgi:hypothetical protein